MALVIPIGFAQASVELRNDGDPDPWYVTFGVDLTDAGGDYDTAAGQIAEAFAGSIGAQLSTATRIVGVNLSIGQDGPDRLIVRYVIPVTTRGTSNEAMLPQNCAALYDKVTARAGRSGKGRIFVPNILPENQVTAVGVLSGTLVADLQNQANNLIDNLGFSDLAPFNTPMVLLHNAGTPDTTPTPVGSLVVQSVISTQRRRLR